jgi:hypothetical protein
VLHVPGTDEAAALGIAISSSGAFAHVETRALVAPQDLAGVLEKAAAARGAYNPRASSRSAQAARAEQRLEVAHQRR